MTHAIHAKIVLALLVLANALAADTITFNGNRATIDDAQIKITADTMRQIAWSKARGADKGSAYPWEVASYVLSRNPRGPTAKEAAKFEESWNRAIRSGSRAAWATMSDMVKAALEAEQSKTFAGYEDMDHMRLRLLAYDLRAKAALKQDITQAIDDYAAANKAYAEKMVKDYKVGAVFPQTDNSMFAGIDYGAAHSTTFDVLMAIALWHRDNGRFDEAYNNGYEPAKVLAEELRQATRREQFGRDYAIVALNEAARMFTTGESPQWEKAANIYAEISSMYIGLNDFVLANRAEMAGARCQVNLGNDAKASSTYQRRIDEYEKRYDNDPPPKGWLTPEKAAVYAAAYTGLGRIASKKGNHFDALKLFVKSLALFSADREERAEALLNAGLTCVELAKQNNKQAEFYYRSGKSYHDELVTTLKDTAAGAKSPDLLTALGAIAPKN